METDGFDWVFIRKVKLRELQEEKNVKFTWHANNASE